MGQEAEEVVQEEVIIEGEAVEEEAVLAEVKLDDDGNPVEVEETNDEVEIVREGTQPQFTQQQVNDIVNKRVKRLNGKVTESNDTATETNAALELATQRNKILEMALDQAKAAKVSEIKLPDPNDFDDGVTDAEYIKQHGDYTNSIIAKQVAEQVARATQTVATTHNKTQQSEALLSKQVKHYERAEEIGAKDYEATEDKALEILGNDTAKVIIENYDNSHIILYYLGKNPDEAKHIASLVESKQSVKAIDAVAGLSRDLKLKPKTKIVADPDEEIQGDGNTQDGAIERRLTKLRDAAAKSGDMKDLMAFKRKHKL